MPGVFDQLPAFLRPAGPSSPQTWSRIQYSSSVSPFLLVRYYNSGSMLGCDGKVCSRGSVDFLTALACIQLEGGLFPSRVGLVLSPSPGGAGSG